MAGGRGHLSFPKIRRIELPEIYPTENAMRSWGHNKHNYHPDCWDLEYVPHRYLSGLEEADLHQRYNDIIKNMRVYAHRLRGVIPINSYLSCWYWYRKEHQTRLEFAIRGLDCPFTGFDEPALLYPESADCLVSNGQQKLFRYGNIRYMRQMVDEGLLRFVPSKEYDRCEHNAARRDNENQKSSFLPGKYITITDTRGNKSTPVGDLKQTFSGPEYYMLCMSCIFDEHLFDEFEADSCVVIHDPNEFMKRIARIGMEVFPKWYFFSGPVNYYDPYEVGRNERIDTALSKNFRFSYQKEYRVLFSHLTGDPREGYQFVRVEETRDGMEIFSKEGNRLPRSQ